MARIINLNDYRRQKRRRVPGKNSVKALADDTINWVEDGRLYVGSRSNPEHVRRWQAAKKH